MPRVKPGAGFAADIVSVIVFCAIGRRSHAEGLTPAGVAHTSWPFLTGTVAGWLISRGWRAPAELRPTGLVVWVATVVVGMALRRATSQTVAPAFVGVTSTVTGTFLLGWRAAVRKRGPSAAS